jgi:phosphomannomutase
MPNPSNGLPGAEIAVAPPPVSSTGPSMLREALGKMTLDVFVYTDVEADRMVVINGRRYTEGEYVDGLYLIDNITPEGVALRYRGERAVLRP